MDERQLLIVEDDTGFARTLKRSFERRGYGVAVATSLEEVRKLLGTPAAAQWSSPLPATPDYKTHRTFVTPPMKAPGLYVIAASANAGFTAGASTRSWMISSEPLPSSTSASLGIPSTSRRIFFSRGAPESG